MNEYVKLILAGKEYKLSFEAGIIRILKRKFDIKFISLIQSYDSIESIIEFMPEVIYAAAACYCSIEKKPVDFTIEEITGKLDGLNVSDYTPIVEIITEAYMKPLKERSTTSPEVEVSSEPFQLGESGRDTIRPDVNAPVGSGQVHVQRPSMQAAGV